MLLGYMLVQKNFLIKIHLERKGRQKGKKERNGIGANRDSVRFFSFKFFFKERPGSLAGWLAGWRAANKGAVFSEEQFGYQRKTRARDGAKKRRKGKQTLTKPGGKET